MSFDTKPYDPSSTFTQEQMTRAYKEGIVTGAFLMFIAAPFIWLIIATVWPR